MTATCLTSNTADRRTILMVEDEPVLLETIGECLRDWGYCVLEASSATEAMARLSGPVQVDLLFTDIRMPGRMDGFALARWVRDRYPGVHILLTTGYEGPGASQNGAPQDGPILRKPYELETLRRRVASLLTGQASARGPG